MKDKTAEDTATESAQPLKTGAQCVIDGLVKAGCEVLFGYPGGAVLDIFNSLYDAPFNFVLARHEQGAVHMADGYARATGKPGCCLVTSGPGATNTVTGLATAYMDGIPLVCITGQVALNMIGNDAFQEADVIGITRPVTKHNFLVRDADELPGIIAKAFYIATTGKPGPVVIDIPKNIQKQKTAAQPPEKVEMRAYHPDVPINPAEIAQFADLINCAARPLLYVGGGAISGNASEALTALAHKANIPVCSTLMGLGAFSEDDPLALRMLGMHGSVAANYAVDHCDLLVSVGARFDDRVTGKIAAFASKATIVHIDIDRSSIGKSVRADLGVQGYVKPVLEAVLPFVKSADHAEWIAQVNRWKERFPFTYPVHGDELMPQYVIEQIYAVSQGRAVVTTDVGQNQMWATQYFRYTRPRNFISSGGLGTMGFGLPASIGAQFGRPGELVVCVTGDGGVQMNFQELVVAVEHKVPIVVVILNNGYLGMVRQWQELFYGKRYSGVMLSQHGRLPNEHVKDAPAYLPDFVKMAEAHGACARRITKPEEVAPALSEAFASRKTWVLECIVSPEANVFPMIPPGSHVAEMINRTV
ncbi:MAG TPA: biosynthetic-type acetolactate synthase large subunit [Kiritimatiellia bacterium]|nr:biosynthetic-type acetolactate synthase large subunit [Kiritimatiellia bacterium]HPS06289.1 biosynthetic-type acetolactate synthase large subunit [Kiritimatiellia bacterium]